INPNFASSKAMSIRSKEPDVLTKEMAMLGQELMLCRADSLDLIRGNASPDRQLQFLEQLLARVPGSKKSAGNRPNTEMLLNELYAAETLPHLTQMLTPTLDPWPAHIKALRKGAKTSSKPSREEAADVAALLQASQSALEQLKSECEFLNEAESPAVFSPSSLRVAASDLRQLMSTFSHVYETDLRAYCSRDPPNLGTESDVFQRIHQLLLACSTELEMLNKVSEASASVNEDVKQLQTQACYWNRGEKRPLRKQIFSLTCTLACCLLHGVEYLLLLLPADQLEELTRHIKDFSTLLHS
ncbi:hypothetical protein L3Q82_015525, partial [Scortum barcoo]